jgi:hypothetical protein
MKTKYNTSLLFICLLLALTNSCCKDEENPDVQPSTERYTGDSYGELNSPWVKDEKQQTHQTIWSCIYFGTYPTNEVVSGAFTAVDDYALAEGDVIVDASLYQRLQQADWDAADDAVIDGNRYHRINGSTAVEASTNREQHYRWGEVNEWHYFTYEPIKWRVLNITGSQAMLLTDRMPDTHPFQNVDEDTNWSLSDLRQWLNSIFLSSAFSSEERNAILETHLENAPNSYFNTSSGPDTQDYVFILSGNEVFSSPKASDYGFYAGSGFDDPARRFRSTLYAKCRGAWWSPVEGYRGNSFWMMRTSGYNHNYVTYICDFGYIYQQGTAVTCDDAALLPAVTIDLSRAPYSVAPSVSCR